MIDLLVKEGFVTYDSVFSKWSKNKGFAQSCTPVNKESVFIRKYDIFDEFQGGVVSGYDVMVYLGKIKRWVKEHHYWDTQILPSRLGYKYDFIDQLTNDFYYTNLIESVSIHKKKEGAIYNETKGILYFYKAGNYVKIGITSSPISRKNTISCHCPIEGDYVANFFYKNPCEIEKFLHKELQRYNSNKEWFILGDELMNDWIKFLSFVDEDTILEQMGNIGKEFTSIILQCDKIDSIYRN